MEFCWPSWLEGQILYQDCLRPWGVFSLFPGMKYSPGKYGSSTYLLWGELRMDFIFFFTLPCTSPMCYCKHVLLLLQMEKMLFTKSLASVPQQYTRHKFHTPGWTITLPPAAMPFLIYLFMYSPKILIGHLTRITLVLGFKDTQVVHKRLRAWLWHWQDLALPPAGWASG